MTCLGEALGCQLIDQYGDTTSVAKNWTPVQCGFLSNRGKIHAHQTCQTPREMCKTQNFTL